MEGLSFARLVGYKRAGLIGAVEYRSEERALMCGTAEARYAIAWSRHNRMGGVIAISPRVKAHPDA